MRIEPVKFSAGPFLDGCEPLRVIAMGFGSFDGALELERLAIDRACGDRNARGG